MFRFSTNISKVFQIRSLSSIQNASSHTIFALSSGFGRSGVAVIRVSGPGTQNALSRMSGLTNPKPRTALLRSIRHPSNREVLDKGLVLWFPGPHSFTGEDCCEFHVHGGPAVVNSVLDALSLIPMFQLAGPGEFSRRAFYNGKLDLTELEGLSDLLHAETEVQRRQAFLQSQGSLSKLYNQWRTVLLNCVAHVEAYIDFEETETIGETLLENAFKDIENLSRDLELHLHHGRQGELIRSGIKTVIVGEPNVGKSSLFNILCQRPAAIVTPLEGTTRDLLTITLNIGGYPLVLVDTAGLHSNSTDLIEQIGIERAFESCNKADYIILVIDYSKFEKWLLKNSHKNPEHYIKEYLKSLNLHHLELGNGALSKNLTVVFNKTDLGVDCRHKKKLSCYNDNIVYISCKSEEGILDLTNNISRQLKTICGEPNEEHPSMNQLRHRQHLSKCLYYLNLFLQKGSGRNEQIPYRSLGIINDTSLLAEYLRKSLKHLGYLVGVTTTEQMLDIIFKDFCIGK